MTCPYQPRAMAGYYFRHTRRGVTLIAFVVLTVLCVITVLLYGSSFSTSLERLVPHDGLDTASVTLVRSSSSTVYSLKKPSGFPAGLLQSLSSVMPLTTASLPWRSVESSTNASRRAKALGVSRESVVKTSNGTNTVTSKEASQGHRPSTRERDARVPTSAAQQQARSSAPSVPTDSHTPPPNTTVREAGTSRARECGKTHFRPVDNALALFQPAVAGDDLCLLLDIVAALDRALTEANITYFLYGGTLIGSWRHHGLIPWDDDVDVAVDITRQTDLRKALKSLEPQFLFKERPLVSWKFFSERGSEIFLWRWPFVDICFFDQNATHVYEHDLKMFPKFIFPKDWVFPTVLRPFNGLTLPAPRKTRLVLDRTYNVTQCAIGHYSHRRERGKPESEIKTVACDTLQAVYPFVQHVPLGAAGCNESLELNGTSLSWTLLDKSQC